MNPRGNQTQTGQDAIGKRKRDSAGKVPGIFDAAGDDEWRDQTVRELELESTMRDVGRPRKAVAT